MPDWTYHPLFKPVLFRLPPEEGRRLTLRLLEIQARTAAGRRVFRLFGHGIPPSELAVEAFGLRFPGPLGLGPGIDTEAIAMSVLQLLGLGYVCVGPVGADAVPRRHATDPLRVAERHALVESARAGGPSARAVAARIRAAPGLAVPIGVALRGADLARAIADAEAEASFFVLPPSASPPSASETLAELRAATARPLLLRLGGDWDDARIDRAVEEAAAAGVAGCVALAGIPSPLLPDGEMTGPFLRARSLAVIERVARRHGDRFPVIAAGGILSPDDALDALDAGARLVELHEGLIYAGPGLPGRVLHRLEHRLAGPARPRSEPPAVAPPAAAPAHPIGSMLLTATGVALIASGLGALVLAATIKLFPYDLRYLGMTVEALCARNGCRIVHFMAHDRVSFGGAILAIGVMYTWLARVPIRRGEPWAWWTLGLSGVVGFASFLTYLGYGYLDVWHGRATVALLAVYVAGMVLAHAGLSRPRGPRSLLRAGARAWTYSPAGLGRCCLTFAAVGMILGGVVIMGVGVTRVFVPQDLDYMGVSVAELRALSPRLVPLIAHDRAGFGGGLLSGGITIFFSLWCGARPGARGLWWALLAAGIVGFGCAIGVHPAVGYTSFTHLAPAYAGALSFALGMRLLHAPMCRVDDAGGAFPDV